LSNTKILYPAKNPYGEAAENIHRIIKQKVELRIRTRHRPKGTWDFRLRTATPRQDGTASMRRRNKKQTHNNAIGRRDDGVVQLQDVVVDN
jgi:hypothetical protein